MNGQTSRALSRRQKGLTVNQGDARTVRATLADPFQIALEEFGSTNFETFLDHLGRKLVHAILSRIAKDVVDRTAAVSRRAMFTNVLDTPIAKLSMGHNINAL